MKLRLGIEARERAYLLTEALVYIGAVVVLLGVGFIAMHRCVDQSLALRRNADDIARTTHVGELWRQDIRGGAKGIKLETSAGEQLLRIEGSGTNIEYRFANGELNRRVGSGPWSCILRKVKASSMRSEPRSSTTAWIWDVELLPQTKGVVREGRVRPVFSFIAAAPQAVAQ